VSYRRGVRGTSKRSVAWSFGGGLLLSIFALGVLGDPPYSVVRAVLATATAAALALIPARMFDDGAGAWSLRYGSALAGVLLLPFASVGVDWG
jgi:hypothetical protein